MTADRSPIDCPYCDRRFAAADLLALHEGLAHVERLDAAERAAYRDALAAEEAALRRFRLKALAALVLLYFGLLFTYAVVT